MKMNLKMASIGAIILLVSGIVAFVSANSFKPANTNEQKIFTSDELSAMSQMQRHMRPYMQQLRCAQVPDWLNRFLQNATATQVSGTVVLQSRGMLVLNTGNGQARVLIPKIWMVNNEAIGRQNLFNASFSFSGPGQTLTVNILKSTLVESDSFNINVMIGYEAINGTGAHAYAVLPFNIEPHT